MQPTQNPLSEAVRVATATRLNARLVQLLDLAAVAWTAHWNVRGVAYEELHKRFGKVVDDAHDAVDRVAEMSRQLGGDPVAMMPAIPALQPGASNGAAYLGSVIGAVVKLLAALRADIAAVAADPIAENLLIEVATTFQAHLAHMEASRAGYV